jgi:hypothetical protein
MNIETKLDKIMDKLEQQSNTLARHGVLHEKNTEDLEEHIRRTAMLETQMDTALLPIKFVKMLVAISLGSAAVIGLFQLIKQVIGN